jgi:hypothetical protein
MERMYEREVSKRETSGINFLTGIQFFLIGTWSIVLKSTFRISQEKINLGTGLSAALRPSLQSRRSWSGYFSSSNNTNVEAADGFTLPDFSG